MLITSRNLSEGVTGSNVRDTENRNRFTREGAERLGQNIRSGMTGNNISPNRNQYRISRAAGTMAKNVADNTVELQKIMESQGDETRDEISKLLKMMLNAQKLTGESSVRAIKEIVKQTEKITIAAGDQSEDVRKLLGIDSVQKQLYGGSIGERAVSGIKGFVGADQGAGVLDTVKQAFEPSRLFGNSGFFGLGANRNKRINAIREAKIEAAAGGQFPGVASAMEELGLAAPLASNTAAAAPLAVNRAKSIGTLGTQPRGITPGIDMKGEPEKQTDLLQQILKELKKLNDKEMGGGGLTGLLGAGVAGATVAGVSMATIGTVVMTALGSLLLGGAIIAGSEEEFKDGARAGGLFNKSELGLPENVVNPNNGSTTSTSTTTPTTVNPSMTRTRIYVPNNNGNPAFDEGQEYIINIDGVERSVTEEEYSKYLENVSTSQASVNVLSTSRAVENLTPASNETTINAPTINNITNNNTTSGSNSNPINVIKDTIRDTTPVLLRKLNKSYA